mmetsp:Transcript_99088/g.256184  ORF Transcript_99088/g.256184 Transcript_99088/m.256184 type:complete len:122 (+) Transcript_99088:80-445(+)
MAFRSRSPILAVAALLAVVMFAQQSVFVPPAARSAAVAQQSADAAKLAAALAVVSSVPAPALALQGEEDDGFDLRIIAVLGLPLVAASWALFNVWRVAFRQGARIGETVSGSSKIGLRAEE